MTDPAAHATGRCRCGAVEFSVTGPPLITSACHCRGCQRMSASPCSLTASYPVDALRLTRGQTVRGGLGGPLLHHHHCDRCKSWLYTTIDGAPFVNVRSALVDPNLAPYIETHTAHALPWVTTPAAHRFDAAPDLDAFQALMRSYPAWAAEMRARVENGCSASPDRATLAPPPTEIPMAHTDPPLPAQGGCRCGKLRFEITAPALLTSACHCTGCQRMTGGAYSVTSAYPLDGFRVVDGEPVLGGLKGPVAHHHHCDHCKSWVYTTAEGAPFVNVRSTMLDDPSGFEPFIEVWTAEKLPWVTTPAVHSYESQPAYEDYEGLIGEFMGRGK